MKRSKFTKALKQRLGAEAKRFFTNCGQMTINGAGYTDSDEFVASFSDTKYVYKEEAERIIEELRSLNVILETLAQGNQYVPEIPNGKCPKLIIEANVDGVHIGVEWW